MLKKLLTFIFKLLFQPRTTLDPQPTPTIFLRTTDGMRHDAIGTEIKIDTDLRVYTKIKNKWVLAPQIDCIVFKNTDFI